MFTKRHYEFLARFLAYEISVSSPDRAETLKGLARLLASKLRADNPKFDAQQFLDAAGETKR